MPRNRNPEAEPEPSSPTPEPIPLPEPEPSPLFTPTSPPPIPIPGEPTTSEPGAAWSESPDTSPSSESGDASASPPRSTRARLRELRKMAAAAVTTAGGMAHQLLTREGSAERQIGLWVPDEDDVTAISEPLAGLASRRMPEGAENPDLADAIALVLGLVTYAVKQRARAAQAALWGVGTGGDDPEADDEPNEAPGAEL